MSTLRRRDALHQRSLHYGPNMTPMVDVVMVILIFYMSAASFVGSEWFLRTALPKPGAAAGPSASDANKDNPFDLGAARFEITLSPGPGGATIVRGRGFEGVSLVDLPARLKELSQGTDEKDVVLIIRSEPDVPYGDVIKAHDAASAAGITQIGLMDSKN
jgi:biopolymer transport protein ExbD